MQLWATAKLGRKIERIKTITTVDDLAKTADKPAFVSLNLPGMESSRQSGISAQKERLVHGEPL
jgi:hypothetical protein